MNKTKVIFLVTLSALTSLYVTTVLAVEDAGRVMFVAGKANIVNAAGLERVARKGDLLKQGDRLVTTDKGVIQVKMRDDGIMAVRPNTDLKLNDMVPQLNKTDAPSQSLLLSRGGVRVLTGNERSKLGYLIKTAATSLHLRDGDTEALVIPKLTPAAGRVAELTPAGTYNRVNAGTGIIQGIAGKGINLEANQISYAPSASVTPVRVASLPPSFINTTVSLQQASATKPSIATTAPPPASVPGGIVIAPVIITPTALTATAPASVVGTATIAPTKLAPATVIGAAPLVSLTPPPAPIAVTASLPPPPVMIASPTLISKPILVIQPVVILPPPPQPVTTVTVTPTTTEPTTPTTTEPLIPTTTKLTTTVISTTGGTLKGTFCIKGQIC